MPVLPKKESCVKAKNKVLIPTPRYGFDPTEVSIPWKLLTDNDNDIEVVFATPDGEKSQADKLMVTGERLGIWKSALRARKDAVEAYQALQTDTAFSSPIKYEDIDYRDYDGIILPGGHDKAIREYLESDILQKVVVDFFTDNKPVGAICHGVVLAARSIDPKTNRSVLYDYKTTCLLKSQERLAYNMTRLWLKDYYLTYPETTVEDEVKSVLKDSKNFQKGSSPLGRDDLQHLNKGFTVKDRNYISARWPGDVYSFSTEFLEMLRKT